MCMTLCVSRTFNLFCVFLPPFVGIIFFFIP